MVVILFLSPFMKNGCFSLQWLSCSSIRLSSSRQSPVSSNRSLFFYSVIYCTALPKSIVLYRIILPHTFSTNIRIRFRETLLIPEWNWVVIEANMQQRTSIHTNEPRNSYDGSILRQIQRYINKKQNYWKQNN